MWKALVLAVVILGELTLIAAGNVSICDTLLSTPAVYSTGRGRICYFMENLVPYPSYDSANEACIHSRLTRKAHLVAPESQEAGDELLSLFEESLNFLSFLYDTVEAWVLGMVDDHDVQGKTETGNLIWRNKSSPEGQDQCCALRHAPSPSRLQLKPSRSPAHPSVSCLVMRLNLTGVSFWWGYVRTTCHVPHDDTITQRFALCQVEDDAVNQICEGGETHACDDAILTRNPNIGRNGASNGALCNTVIVQYFFLCITNIFVFIAFSHHYSQ